MTWLLPCGRLKLSGGIRIVNPGASMNLCTVIGAGATHPTASITAASDSGNSSEHAQVVVYGMRM